MPEVTKEREDEIIRKLEDLRILISKGQGPGAPAQFEKYTNAWYIGVYKNLEDHEKTDLVDASIIPLIDLDDQFTFLELLPEGRTKSFYKMIDCMNPARGIDTQKIQDRWIDEELIVYLLEKCTLSIEDERASYAFNIYCTLKERQEYYKNINISKRLFALDPFRKRCLHELPEFTILPDEDIKELLSWARSEGNNVLVDVFRRLKIARPQIKDWFDYCVTLLEHSPKSVINNLNTQTGDIADPEHPSVEKSKITAHTLLVRQNFIKILLELDPANESLKKKGLKLSHKLTEVARKNIESSDKQYWIDLISRVPTPLINEKFIMGILYKLDCWDIPKMVDSIPVEFLTKKVLDKIIESGELTAITKLPEEYITFENIEKTVRACDLFTVTRIWEDVPLMFRNEILRDQIRERILAHLDKEQDKKKRLKYIEKVHEDILTEAIQKKARGKSALSKIFGLFGSE